MAMVTPGTMQVLFVTSECTPWIKTGGLGDVAAALPAALREAGVDVRVLLPAYPAVLAQAGMAPVVARTASGVLREAVLPSGVPVFLLEAPEWFGREGGPYQNREGQDWPDNAQRFATLGRVAALLATPDSPLPFRPAILHANDWQTGLAMAWLQRHGKPHAAGVFTVHNLAFQGLFPAQVAGEIGLPPECYQTEGAEFYGQLSFLKAGLYYADAVTTVSPHYAREIQQHPLGFGLEGLLFARRAELQGIVNGIDTTVWDPASDPLIAATYDADRLERKARNKGALQTRMGLDADPSIPVLGLVGRLTDQKGIDLVLAAAERMLALPVQLAVLGKGETALEDGLRGLAARHPGAMAVETGFDETLAHLIEAGSDLFLMPSRFEPCGLNQMYSQRYGTLPVAHATGGLSDTITDYSGPAAAAEATGFLFFEPTADALLAAVARALAVYPDRRRWRKLQRNGMRRDFSWRASAARYIELYQRLRGV